MARLTLFASAAILLLAAARPAAAGAQALPDLLAGRWVIAGSADCRAAVTLRLTGDTLRWTDSAGRGDVQQVVSRREDGIATRTVSSTRGVPTGKTWVYEVLAPGRISLTEGSSGRSAEFQHCIPPIPAGATPRQFVEALYARYAAEEDAALPLSSPANVHAFFAPDLADRIIASVGIEGRLPDGCRRADPFVPAVGEDDYRISDVRVTVTPASADRARGVAAFRRAGAPATVRLDLVRTAAGWRITDVTGPAGRSFRAGLAACRAP